MRKRSFKGDSYMPNRNSGMPLFINDVKSIPSLIKIS